ncbi:hypothetical protein CKM354_000482300 [Cercospora kikuchii]|uniref:CCHC-type domain-containing protein n=1 Tax=Cercospora kikuchii TaxID=84275 RepID=A0A9P3FGI6_9PEZI|nr:uncharacterized protein CKM354_000482300 [Cercospora kikuchii]GIZ41520.1 hypothetical protein CKM354_000482300 [Cercospora kikuchii]
MICSNCDRWHLPQPCEIPLQQCTQCGNYGHIAHYCPVNPLPLRPMRNNVQAPPPAAGADRKRKREDEEESNKLMVKLPLAVLDIKHVHPSLLAQIRRSLVSEVTQLLQQHTRDDILALFLHSVPLPPSGSRHEGGNRPVNQMGQFRPSSSYASTKVSAQHVGPSPSAEQVARVPVTPITAKKAKKHTGQKPCADCKARHQRCRHTTADCERSADAPALPESVDHATLQPALDQQLALDSGLQQSQIEDVFTNQPMLSGAEQMGTIPSGLTLNAPAVEFVPQDTQQEQAWMLNTTVGDLNMLAEAAQQVNAQLGQTPSNDHVQVQADVEIHPSSEQFNAMDFSQLLNSDSAGLHTTGDVHDGQFHGVLELPSEAEQPRKRSTRKKSKPRTSCVYARAN